MTKLPLIRRVRFIVLATVVVVLAISSLVWASDKVKLTFYHRTRNVELVWAREVIDRFHAQYPHIEVTLVPSGTGGGVDYTERLVVLRASGLAPDIYSGYSDKAGFMANGWALDISPYVERDRAELKIEEYFPGVWETFIRGGKQYGIPFTITPQFVFYNADLLASSGLTPLPVSWDDSSWTWDRMVEYSQRLTRQDGAGNYDQLGIVRVTETKLPDVSWMFGTDWFTEQAYQTGVADRMTLNTPENINAYTRVRDLYRDFAAVGPPKGIPVSGFEEGRIAMDWIGAFRLTVFRDVMARGGMGFEWRMAPVPLAENRANTRWNNPFYINADTPHPDEAWEFVKFATSTESQKLWAEITSLMPARASAAEEYIASLSEFSSMPTPELLEVISGAIVHSRASIEELIADVPFEIMARTKELFDPFLNGQISVEEGLLQAQELLDAYIRNLPAREPW